MHGERDGRDLLLEAGLALSSERSLPAILQRIVELSSDPRSVGFPPNHPPMRSFLGAP